ncbi:hypothetical protein C494_20248 [Natronorubrum bangense JCM 10635]|uniref:Uncharacterized protein n=1 Tax=Natronorubrum bangense JCM 10635 TaxID=1227500 RepID=L9VZM0_9EURY|nr:hypothetical protein C494_20248 [Natronorubrum bangense JCM 10635]
MVAVTGEDIELGGTLETAMHENLGQVTASHEQRHGWYRSNVMYSSPLHGFKISSGISSQLI